LIDKIDAGEAGRDKATQIAEEKERRNEMDLNLVIGTYYYVQALRIEMENRARSLLQNGKVLESEADKWFGVSCTAMREIERDWEKALADNVKEHQVWEGFLRDVKGIGPVMASGLLSLIDISKARHASSLWRYFGLDVENGRAPQRKKGEKITWNPQGRLLAYKIGMQFLKARNEKYTDIYYAEKSRLQERGGSHEGCAFPEQMEECILRLAKAAGRKNRKAKTPPCKDHIHKAARRKMVKIFLSHLWERWRIIEGLPVSEPFAIAKLGHAHKIEAL